MCSSPPTAAVNWPDYQRGEEAPPAKRTLAEVGLLHEAQHFAIEAQGLVLVVDVYTLVSLIFIPGLLFSRE
jgi:hypothetical protein